MRMIGIAGTRSELVVVADEQRGEGHIVRVVMVSEGEAVVGDASGRLSSETLPRTSEHDGRLGHLSSIAGYGGRMPARPTPEAIAPGQESVWDYPRPPAIMASDEQIVIRLGGVDICETNTSWRILETSHPPTYYLPRAAFSDGALVPSHGHSFCEWKGQASYLDVVGGSKIARRAAWYYPNPEPHYAAIRGHVAVYAGLMDECLVDGERVLPQPGGFYGGWITSNVVGPFKGIPGSSGW